ncbi:MAG: TraR/DksA family transcriptional regulator [Phycisphaerales bacterium]|nr:TraR/DksA family transcriptional regulator [Phycisphaerales bacterium]
MATVAGIVTKAKTPAHPPAKPPLKPSDAKTVRKGITVVENKQKPKRERPPPTVIPTFGPSLLGPGRPRPKPLIASGPNAGQDDFFARAGKGIKGVKKLDKRQVEKYRQILTRKRAELAGDVNTMESEALTGSSGSLSHLPQHMAEQGSDAYGQSLSLDLAAADRRLIKEIDDALARISAGTYGICELTHQPIKPERLDELPWARHSIEAARELERRSRTK